MADATSEVTSSTSTATSDIQLIEPRRRNSCLGVVIVTGCLVLIWGVSMLPTIFYLIPPPAPSSKASNQSVIPPTTLTCPNVKCRSPLICKTNYKNSGINVCQPPCPWVAFTPSEDLALEIVDNFSIAVSLIIFFIVFFTWINNKHLLKFPHVIPLYIQSLCSAIALLILIGNAMGRATAFCTSDFLDESFLHPTVFCKAQGALIHYLYTALALWFVIYCIKLIQMMLSSDSIIPTHSNRCSYFLSSLACWLLPWIPVGVVLGSEHGYNQFNMRYCVAVDKKLNYFTSTLVIALGQGIGCSCLFFVVYRLYQLRDIPSLEGEQARARRSKMDQIAIRLICLMFAYAVCVALTYITYCTQLQHANLQKYYIIQYFTCLAKQPEHVKCDKTYEKYTFSKTYVASTLSTALFSISTLCFLAFNKQSRKLWLSWWRVLKVVCCPPPAQPQTDK